jgi:hypothetical protein
MMPRVPSLLLPPLDLCSGETVHGNCPCRFRRALINEATISPRIGSFSGWLCKVLLMLLWNVSLSLTAFFSFKYGDSHVLAPALAVLFSSHSS